MTIMNIYGVGVVQNEADVLGESLEWALRFCRHIWLWDLGSTDETLAVAAKFPRDRVTATAHEGLRFSSSLKGRVFAEARPLIPREAWVYIFDADEFLEGPLAEALALADRQRAQKVGVWQASFYPTPADLAALREQGESNWAAQPVAARITHYRIEWFEWRLIRNAPDLVWDTSGPHSQWHISGRPLEPLRGAPPLFVRHYRYRSPQQVALRHRTRRAAPIPGYGQFRYDASDRFEDFARPERGLRRWTPDAPWVVPAAEIWRARFRIWRLRLQRKWQRRRVDNRAGSVE
jgi:hypothetical protein